MKVAVLFNMNSGMSNLNYEEIGKLIANFLKNVDLYGHTSYGGKNLPDAAEIISLSEEDLNKKYSQKLCSAVKQFLKLGIDLFVTVGGDGMASYVADTIICNTDKKHRPSILGIAAGTANVGPIVNVDIKELKTHTIDDYVEFSLDAVEVISEDEHIGYGFNDIILGNTFLGTVDGQLVNLEAESLILSGSKKIVAIGRKIISDNFHLKVNSKIIELDKKNIEQIVISPLKLDHLYGRALYGIFCCCANKKGMAGISFLERAIVDSEFQYPDNKMFSMQQIAFKTGDFVEFFGLGPDAHIIVDGNPYLRNENEDVKCKVAFEVINSFKIGR